MIKALDDHYRYLPETELHEAIEEFLFQLKRRNGEGATSFSSRFRTQLDRVQTLIAQERELARKKRRKKDSGKDAASSSLEETDMSDGAGSYGTARGPAPSAEAEPQVQPRTPPETGDEQEPTAGGAAAAAEPPEEGRAKSEKAGSERSASPSPIISSRISWPKEATWFNTFSWNFSWRSCEEFEENATYAGHTGTR